MPAVVGDRGVHVPREFVPIELDVEIVPPLRGIRCGTAGNISIVDASGSTQVIPGVLAGETISGVIQKVNSENTTIVPVYLLGLR